jgi:hypothetical protein
MVKMVKRAMKGRMATIGLGVAALAMSATPIARANGPVPPFQLEYLDNTPVQSDTVLPTTGKWLLLYVSPNCRPCDRLLGLVTKDALPDLPLKMVIVVGNATGDVATRMRAGVPDLAGAKWYTDQTSSAWAALKMEGVPVVLGMRGTNVEWTLSGTLRSDAELRSVLASWPVE